MAEPSELNNSTISITLKENKQYTLNPRHTQKHTDTETHTYTPIHTEKSFYCLRKIKKQGQEPRKK